VGHGVAGGLDGEGVGVGFGGRPWIRVLRLLVRGASTLRRRSPPSKHQTPPAVHAPIPPVLDGVVAPAMQSPGNLGPALPHLSNEALDQESLFRADGLMVE
jgi:hypothetical protein